MDTLIYTIGDKADNIPNYLFLLSDEVRKK